MFVFIKYLFNNTLALYIPGPLLMILFDNFNNFII